MNSTSFLRYRVIPAMLMLSLVSPSLAQQPAVAPQAQVDNAAPVHAGPPQSPGSPGAAQPGSMAGSDASPATSTELAGRPLKSAAAGLRDLSPWSMFLSADILVKAVMIGLSFASLMTWTIFIAKIVELSLVQRGLRAALGKIDAARSLADAQFALGEIPRRGAIRAALQHNGVVGAAGSCDAGGEAVRRNLPPMLKQGAWPIQ